MTTDTLGDTMNSAHYYSSPFRLLYSDGTSDYYDVSREQFSTLVRRYRLSSGLMRFRPQRRTDAGWVNVRIPAREARKNPLRREL